MPHIALNSAEPGIRGLLRYSPETARPLSELAEVLLRGPGTLTRGERELIAAYVSWLNGCRYCSSSHSACAAAQLPGGMAVVEQVRADPSAAPVSAKLEALLQIASAVVISGHAVAADHVTRARAAGATDREIHDTVLIAATSTGWPRSPRTIPLSTPPAHSDSLPMAICRPQPIPSNNPQHSC